MASIQWSGLSNQRMLLLTKTAYSTRNDAPTMGREVTSTLVCANKERSGPASADQGHYTACQGSCHVHGMS